MARLVQKAKASGHKILIVDDTDEVLESTRLLLEKDGHEIQTANNGPDGIEKVRNWQPHLLILDYFMPGMTGEEVVTRIRPFNKETQILLQTGYASEKPPRQMLHALDIQGYHDKSEGPEKLLIWVDASLKSYRQISTISKGKRGLRHILDAIPEMYNLQTLEELLKGVLEQMEGLLGGYHSFVAALPGALNLPPPEGGKTPDSFAVISNDEELKIVAGTGRFESFDCLDEVDQELLKRLHDTIGQEQVVEDGTRTFVPLRVGNKSLGVIYFDRKSEETYDVELLKIFAMQASQALENRRLFGMATEDDLTKTFLKNFFFKRMEDEVHEACRYEYPISLCIIDVDKFKSVNDTYGHIAGDIVLRSVSNVIRSSVRSHDFVGRFGGDEFVIALPHTDRKIASEVLERLRRKVEATTYEGTPPDVKVTLSCGVATLQSFPAERANLKRAQLTRMIERMLESADQALYVSKEQGRNAVNSAEPLSVDLLLEDREVARS